MEIPSNVRTKKIVNNCDYRHKVPPKKRGASAGRVCLWGQGEVAVVARARALLEARDLPAFRALLSSRIIVHSLRAYKIELLQTAVRDRQAEFLAAMRDVGLLPCDAKDQATFAKFRWCPLLDIIRMGNVTWVRILYEYRILGRTSDFPPITCALRWASLKENAAVDVAILETLIHLGENVNEFYENKTPIYYAAQNKLWHCVEILLKHNAKIDTYCGKKTARQLIEAERPDLLMNIPEPDVRYRMLEALKSGNEEEFIGIVIDHEEMCNELDDQGFTFLQRAIQVDMPHAVDTLLGFGADPNTAYTSAKFYPSDFSSRSSPPIVMAAIRGQIYTFKKLLYHRQIDLNHRYPDNHTIYHFLARDWKYIKNESVREITLECCKLLFKLAFSFNVNILEKNSHGQTALHMACKTRDKELLYFFFKYGAFSDINDEDLETITPEYLNEFLDKSIITEFKSNCNIHQVEIDYSFIDTSRIINNESGTIERQKLLNTDKISDSYMSVKFEDFEVGVEDNKKATKNKIYSEMNLFIRISESRSHVQLLKHPVIRIFLYLKWMKVLRVYMINFIVYLLFTIFLSLYVYDTEEYARLEGRQINRIQEIMSTCNWMLTFVFGIIIFLREVIQFQISKFKYFKSFENLSELTMLVLVACLLFTEIKREVASITVILAYWELTLLLSRNPYISTYVSIFIKVARKSLSLLMLFCPVVFAFAFAFYIIFCESLLHHAANNNTTTHAFPSLSLSIFKTFTMISGEFELDRMNFDISSVLSRVLFISFLIFVIIVFSNVLNALAISDTQAIIDEAELICCAAEVSLYAKLERIWNKYFPCVEKHYLSINVCPLVLYYGTGSHFKFSTHQDAMPLRRRLINKYLYGFDNVEMGKKLIAIAQGRYNKIVPNCCSNHTTLTSNLEDSVIKAMEMKFKMLDDKIVYTQQCIGDLSNDMQEIKRLLSHLYKRK